MLVKIGPSVVAALALCSLLVPSTASASIVFESKGWRISMPFWAGPRAGVAVVEDAAGIADDVLVLEIFKVFRGQPGLFGEMPSVTMTFTQIAGDDRTASKIVINDESVTNLTTVPWTDFHMMLISSDQASFNPAEMFPGGGNDLYPDQFNRYELLPAAETSTAGILPSWMPTRLNFYDGVVGVGDDFAPGSLSGAIVIDTNLTSEYPVVFKLKEIPTIPEPASLALLSGGGGAAVFPPSQGITSC